MAKLQCPACGSYEVESTEHSQSYNAPFGGVKEFVVRLDTCRTCGESGDFAGENTAIVTAAIEAADRESVQQILGWLNDAGISTAYLERVLSLPARTAARWKAGSVSASGLALLRLVRVFPWLLDVAAAHFSEHAAKRMLLVAAASVFDEAVSASGYTYVVGANRGIGDTFDVRATFSPMQRTAIQASVLTQSQAA